MMRRLEGRPVGALSWPWGAALIGPLGLALVACSGDAWPVAPAGPQAERITTLWWVFFGVTALAWLVMMLVLAWSSVRTRHSPEEEAEEEPAASTEENARLRAVVTGAATLTVLTFVGLAIVDFRTEGALRSLERADDPLTIQVVGHRWWWELTYEDTVPARRLTTANELRIPVGRPVRLLVTSRDVIHSLWIPRLHGKHDLIPGYTHDFWIRADEEGVYTGGCAEFCGLQHANMRIEVVAERADRFAAWYESQLAPAAAPDDPLRARGEMVFLGGTCVMCHSVRGTPAGSRIGPDLTHVASRRKIAAGVLTNTRGHLAGWILDPQRIKPGNLMPPNDLSPEDLTALLAYLEGLR